MPTGNTSPILPPSSLGTHAQRVYGSWVVCQFVCLSGLYLAGRAFIRSTNDATYLAGTEVENFCAILSETSPLQSWSPTGIVQLISAAAIFPRLGTRMRTIFFDHSPGSSRVLRLVSCYFHMPPSKVCPKCQAIVPIRLKVCKSCQHAFQAKRKTEQNVPDLSVKRMRMLEKLRKTTKRASETSKIDESKTARTKQALEQLKLASRLCRGVRKTKHAKLA